MYIRTNEDNRVISYSDGDYKNELYFKVSDDIIPSDFEENAFFYRYNDGKFTLDTEYKNEKEHEQMVWKIRSDREAICFPVINRGGLWYELLSEKERIELLAWYQAWLDAPDTLIEPTMPEWLERT